MIEEWATVVGVATQVVSTLALAVLAFVAVSFWRGGSGLSFGSGTDTPTAQAPTGAAPEAVTQLTDDQWKDVLKNPSAQQGNKNAKVTMVEYTDYQCPFCSRYYTDTYGQVKKNFVDTNKVNYIVRDLPLSFHPNSHIAAEAALCAGDQKKYWEMHDQLFGKQAEWSDLSDPKSKFEDYAKTIGINSGNFLKCLTDGKFKKDVDDDIALAAKVGANGTPTFIINGKLLVGAQPYAEFEKAINEALK